MLQAISGALLVAALAAASEGQIAPTATTADQSAEKRADAKPLVLSGCVVRPDADRFTLKDAKSGTFQLNGRGLDIYVGKHVEIRGASSGLHITTGLYPSANVAAQAGAVDPVQAFNSSLPGGAAHGTSVEPLPTFNVARIRTVKGDCK